MTSKNRLWTSGFSLVEMAIVLVIVGLLVGGILRGQELITSSRVRNLTDQGQAIQVAYYAFQDRFKMMPGDLTSTQTKLVNAYTAQAWDNAGDGWVPPDDGPQFFNNLAQAGFIACSQCMAAQTAVSYCTTTTCPVNIFGQAIAFAYPIPGNMPATNATGTYYLSTLAAEGTKAMVSTGMAIDSRLLAEMDRKIDDGNPALGQFRFSDYSNTGTASVESALWNTCVTPSTTGGAAYTWLVATDNQCQGVLLL